MTALQLYPYDSYTQGAVTLFDDYNCTGKFGRFYASTELFEVKEYVSSDMSNRGIYAGTASSIAVPYGVSVGLYSDSSCYGNPYTVDGAKFLDNNDEM